MNIKGQAALIGIKDGTISKGDREGQPWCMLTLQAGGRVLRAFTSGPDVVNGERKQLSEGDGLMGIPVEVTGELSYNANKQSMELTVTGLSALKR